MPPYIHSPVRWVGVGDVAIHQPPLLLRSDSFHLLFLACLNSVMKVTDENDIGKEVVGLSNVNLLTR